MPIRRIAAVAVTAGMALGSPALAEDEAQNSGAPMVLGPIKVEGEGGYVVRRSSTATKTDTPLIETPQAVTIVPAQQIRDQASYNLQEALRYAVGVRNELYGIDNRGDYVAIRGGESTLKYLDGLRMPLAGFWGIIRDEPYAFHQIDILRGPSSVIAGANEPGGVINYVSKRPQAERQGEIGVQFGNYNHKQIMVDSTGPIDREGKWLYRFVGLGKDSDTQVDHADDKRVLVAPSVTWRPSALGSFTVFAEYQYDRSKNTNAFLGLQGTLLPAPNGPIASDLFIGEPDWDRYGGERWRVGYAGNAFIADNWQLRSTFRHDRVDGTMKTMYAGWFSGFFDATGTADPNGQYLERYWYDNYDEYRVTAGDLLLEGKFNTGGIRHTLLVGVDGQIQETSAISGGGFADYFNVYSPVYGTFPEPTTTGVAPSESEIHRFGVLVQDQIKLFDKLSVRLGVRWDKVRNEVRGVSIDKDTATSVNAGVVYEIFPGVAPYVSYSESFDPIISTTLQAFEPKRGKQIETGVKWEPQNMPLQATASFYSIKEENRLTSHPTDPNLSLQIGEAEIKGIELDVKGEVAHTAFLASYTYTRAKASADAFGGNVNPNHQIQGIPEHMASAWAVHDLHSVGLDGFSLGGGVRFIGRVGDGTGDISVPTVTLFDAMAAYTTEHWRFAVNANNIADKDYIAVCLARGDCWFGQRRKVVATITRRW